MPFGELLVCQTLTDYNERFKFTGKEHDDETGYDFFGARYHASALPSWLSVDPLADKYSYISPYAYYNWNSVKYVDKDGRDVYVFDENGSYTEKRINDGGHFDSKDDQLSIKLGFLWRKQNK